MEISLPRAALRVSDGKVIASPAAIGHRSLNDHKPLDRRAGFRKDAGLD
jgi:hypothetical protein